MSVPERFDLLCRTDREVALRAAARYIDLLLHHHECVHVCVCSLILLLPKGHQCSAGYSRNQRPFVQLVARTTIQAYSF